MQDLDLSLGTWIYSDEKLNKQMPFLNWNCQNGQDAIIKEQQIGARFWFALSQFQTQEVEDEEE